MKKRTMAAALVVLLAAAGSQAAGFKDSFDDADTSEKGVSGYSMYGDSTEDRGITAQRSVSGKQCAFVVVDMSKEHWGSIMLRDAGQWSVQGCTISAQVSTSSDLSTKGGLVAFKLIDADGTGARTRDANLFTLGPGWNRITQSADDLTQEDEPGSQPGLDLANIVQYGIIFYDRGDVNHPITFFVDDVEATPHNADVASTQP